MSKYVCTVCGYIYEESEGKLWKDLPAGWTCPLCSAPKSAFELQGGGEAKEEVAIVANNETRELQEYEMATVSSNLAKGCEKQYFMEASEAFSKLEAYFNSKSKSSVVLSIGDMAKKISDEINTDFSNANSIVDQSGDRGAKRALVWSEKVTRMQHSILESYESEGDTYLENSKIYVCEICGFMYVGDECPEICPVCKVPNNKMTEIGRD